MFTEIATNLLAASFLRAIRSLLAAIRSSGSVESTEGPTSSSSPLELMISSVQSSANSAGDYVAMPRPPLITWQEKETNWSIVIFLMFHQNDNWFDYVWNISIIKQIIKPFSNFWKKISILPEVTQSTSFFQVRATWRYVESWQIYKVYRVSSSVFNFYVLICSTLCFA